MPSLPNSGLRVRATVAIPGHRQRRVRLERGNRPAIAAQGFDGNQGTRKCLSPAFGIRARTDRRICIQSRDSLFSPQIEVRSSGSLRPCHCCCQAHLSDRCAAVREFEPAPIPGNGKRAPTDGTYVCVCSSVAERTPRKLQKGLAWAASGWSANGRSLPHSVWCSRCRDIRVQCRVHYMGLR